MSCENGPKCVPIAITIQSKPGSAAPRSGDCTIPVYNHSFGRRAPQYSRLRCGPPVYQLRGDDEALNRNASEPIASAMAQIPSRYERNPDDTLDRNPSRTAARQPAAASG